MFLDVNDEYSGQVAAWGRLNFASPRIAVRELIHERVRLEIERLCATKNVGPTTMTLTATEQRLNGATPASPISRVMVVDAPAADRSSLSKHVALAEQAFDQGRYFVLLDDRQAESLDDMIDLARTAEVTFFLLTPLKGG